MVLEGSFFNVLEFENSASYYTISIFNTIFE